MIHRGRLADALFLRALELAVASGAATVVTPDGGSTVVGGGIPEARLIINDRRAYGAIARGGMLGFAEAYMDGLVDVDDLGALIEWGARNHIMRTRGRSGRLLGPVRTVWQRLAATRSHPRVTTMTEHYDLGNEFYASWLDQTMTYSSARFPGPDSTLEEAQLNKYRRIVEMAGLRPGMRVLEIGCGWGGFAAFAAAEHGLDVVGVTLSGEHASFARKRLAESGLTDLTDIRLCDFGQIEGRFDAVVSIEMIESVDETVWPRLFAAIADRLDRDGTAVLQAITISDDLFAAYRTRHDFIQRYIFPGGQLPSPTLLARLGDSVGLSTSAVESFGLDYARTLDLWAEAFDAAWGTPATTGLDERFRRMWMLYLTYCAAGFRVGTIDVEQRAYRW